jgi:sporulation protein YlmC with PRC-barrel domain
MATEERSAAELAGRARALAEQALHAQAAGNADDADRLLSEAQQLDPDAVAVVLNEHDAGVAPDARDTPTANQDAERIRRVEPDIDPTSYPGGTGSADRKLAASQSSPPHPLVESDQIHGTAVYDATGKRIGTIRRLVIEKVSGQVVHAVTAFGGFPGLGADIYTIPWERLHYDAALGGYRTDITESQLQNAPEFSREDRSLLSHQQRKDLNEYYMIAPSG